ncbi:MAG: TonB-dependent receptor [Cytophagales bacterium]|nr:TonB-dependent receptor [Cytophagales bacterium]
MKKIFILLTIAFSLFSALLFAQKNTIKGKITDAKTQETLVGVNVVLDDTSGTATDFNGNYELKVSEGKHTLLYRFIGYTSQLKVIEVIAGKTVTIDIALEEEATELGTVVISAGKFEQRIEDITVSMEVIKPNIVENKATTNMETVIDQVPGVQLVDKEVQIRGGSGYSFGAGSRVMIMVDDMPLLSGDANRPEWNFFPFENLEQIEIIKGASSVLYGSSALSGVINIRTAYPKAEPQTKINIQSGFYDQPQRKHAVYWGEANPVFTGMNFFHSRIINKNLDLVIGGNVYLDDSYVGGSPPAISNNGDTIPAHNGSFENRIRLNTNLRYRSEKIEGLDFGVNFNAMYAQFTSNLLVLDTDTGLYLSYPGGITCTCPSTAFNIDPFVNYNDKKGNRYSLRTRVYYIDFDNDNRQANQSTIYFGEYQHQKRFNKIKDFTAIAGIMSTYTKSNAEIYKGNEDSSGVNTAANVAGYLQLDKKFYERITVSAGARREYFNVNNIDKRAKTVFRTGVSARLLKETYMRASFGQGFRFPTISEKYIITTVGAMKVFPNPDVKEETSWNAEVGIKQGIKLREFYGYLDLAYFRQEITNAIEFNFGLWGNNTNLFKIAENFGFKSINVGKARISGLDFSLVGHGKIGRMTINVLAGHTFTNPIALTPDLIIDSTKRIAINPFTNDTTIISNQISYKSSSTDTSGILKYRFQHLTKADVEISYSKFSLGISFRYFSFMKNIDKVFEDLSSQGKSLPPDIKKYRQEHNKGDYLFDLRASYEMSKSSKIAVIIKNLLNHEYMVRPLQIQPPRTFTVQYTLKF